MPTDNSSLLSLAGLHSDTFSAPVVIAGLLFGPIGFVALIHAHKNREPRGLIIGILLMGYPFFVTQAVLTWVIGIGLTATLFFF